MSADGSFAFSGAPSPEELARFDLNDFGNAMRLIRLVGGEVDDAIFPARFEIDHVRVYRQKPRGSAAVDGADQQLGD